MKIDIKKLDKIKLFFKKLPKILAEHAFLASLILIFVSLVLGGFVFYRYYTLAQVSEPLIIKGWVEFDEEIYQEVLGEQKTRQERFEAVGLQEYPNPFRRPTLGEVVPEELLEELTE